MNIAHIGFFGKDNFGDDIMQYYIGEILFQNCKNKVTCYSDSDTPTTINGIKDLSWLDSDLIVIGGGSIMKKDFWALSYQNLMAMINRKAKVIFITVSMSKDVIDDDLFSHLLKELNAKWFVRDKSSVEILKKISIVGSILSDISSYKCVFPVQKQEPKKLVVFLNYYKFGNLLQDTSKKISHLQTIAQYLDWMSTFGWKIEFIAAQTSKSIDDRIVNGLCYSMMQNKENAEMIMEKLSFQEIIDKILTASLVLSMRYHSTVIAAINNIPFIDLTHSDKNKNFLDDTNTSKNSVMVDEINHRALVNVTKYVETNHPKIIIKNDSWPMFEKSF